MAQRKIDVVEVKDRIYNILVDDTAYVEVDITSGGTYEIYKLVPSRTYWHTCDNKNDFNQKFKRFKEQIDHNVPLNQLTFQNQTYTLLRSPNGNYWKITISNTGQIQINPTTDDY